MLFNFIKGLVTENVSEPIESLKIHIIGETMHANSPPGVFIVRYGRDMDKQEQMV